MQVWVAEVPEQQLTTLGTSAYAGPRVFETERDAKTWVDRELPRELRAEARIWQML